MGRPTAHLEIVWPINLIGHAEHRPLRPGGDRSSRDVIDGLGGGPIAMAGWVVEW